MRTAWIILAVLAGVGLAAARGARMLESRASAAHLDRVTPRRGMESFTSSSACRGCHPREHATWFASYHRTMTQLATPEAVMGRFDGSTLDLAGVTHGVDRRGDEFWVETVDPSWLRTRATGEDVGEAPMIQRRIAMVTGSHHMQLYWIASESDRKLDSFPFAFLLDEQRWVPNEATLLRPFDDNAVYTWNRVCIKCHSVAGSPGFEQATGAVDSSVAELGIACEACHGPGHEHVAANGNPVRRERLHLSGDADPTIVNPARADHRKSTEICGQCHSISLFRDEDGWLAHGSGYRAGESLETFARVVRHPFDADQPWVDSVLETDPEFLVGRYWSDGMVRVSGRELNGTSESPCYQRGELSCLSCHSMHESEPDDQLGAGMEGDHACVQCHEEHADNVEAHTHHPAASAGSRCYNCHMPHTTYGLLKAIRSHEIDSPSATVERATGRPNACNACHLDRSLAWTSQWSTKWYGTGAGATEELPRSVVGALSGDAGQRALWAWHLGWDPALEASGQAWTAEVLIELLDDPYPAVRFIAYRSLRKVAGFEDFPFDYVASSNERAEAIADARTRWAGEATKGLVERETIHELMRRRNNRRIDLRE